MRPAAALAVLAVAWAAWWAAGEVVARHGLPVALLLQQAGLFVLALSLLERALARLPRAKARQAHDG